MCDCAKKKLCIVFSHIIGYTGGHYFFNSSYHSIKSFFNIEESNTQTDKHGTKSPIVIVHDDK